MISRRLFLASAAAVSCAAAVHPDFLEAADGEARNHVIIIEKFRFVAEGHQIQPGDTVSWINRDIVPHTATAVDESWDTGSIEPGQQKAIMVTGNMFRDYYCLFHPMMKASLDIVPGQG